MPLLLSALKKKSYWHYFPYTEMKKYNKESNKSLMLIYSKEKKVGECIKTRENSQIHNSQDFKDTLSFAC